MEQNVIPSESKLGEQNVVPSQLRVEKCYIIRIEDW
jgi:hypothetical protein